MFSRSRKVLYVVGAAHLSIAASAADSFSAYTKSLVDLMNIYDKLDEAAAKKIAANERYLLAKAMLRLSSSFYQLKNDKSDFYDTVENSLKGDGRVPPKLYDDIQALKDTTACLSKNLNDVGARLGVAAETQGQDLETALQNDIHLKASMISEIVRELEIGSTGPDVLSTVLADAKIARDTAEQLYRKSADFAKLLDPDAVLGAEDAKCSPQQ
jgi:hypothetical protein